MNREMVTLELRLVAQTGAAYGFTEDAPDDPVIWVPKSLASISEIASLPDGIVEVEMPEWLAVNKGLV